MKRGFTLVELIGTVVILGLIALLAFPPMLNMINNSKSEVSEATKSFIYTAAQTYVNQNMNDFPKTEGKIYCITLRSLVREGLLTDNLKDVETNKNINLDNKVQIKYANGKFDYILNNECVAN